MNASSAQESMTQRNAVTARPRPTVPILRSAIAPIAEPVESTPILQSRNGISEPSISEMRNENEQRFVDNSQHTIWNSGLCNFAAALSDSLALAVFVLLISL